MTHTLGIEFGSTRIKAVLIDEAFRPVASGDYTWKSDLRDGVWTYDLEEAWSGLRTALRALGEVSVDAMGISAIECTAIWPLTRTGICSRPSAPGRTP